MWSLLHIYSSPECQRVSFHSSVTEVWLDICSPLLTLGLFGRMALDGIRMPDGCYADGTWELKMHVTDLHRDVSLRVTGEIHIGGVMLKLVEKLGMRAHSHRAGVRAVHLGFSEQLIWSVLNRLEWTLDWLILTHGRNDNLLRVCRFQMHSFSWIKVDVVGCNSVVNLCVSMADSGYLFIFVWQ